MQMFSSMQRGAVFPAPRTSIQNDASDRHQYAPLSEERKAELENERPPTAAEIAQYTRVLNFPAQIQGHGVFLLLNSAKERSIIACSKNCDMIFDQKHQQLLGTDFLDLFEEPDQINKILMADDVALTNPVLATIKAGGKSTVVNLIINQGPNGIIVDVLEMDPTENFMNNMDSVREAAKNFDGLTTVNELCEQVVSEVYGILGYDKVHMFHHHEDGEGVIVSERRSGRMSVSWLGMHWPPTDMAAKQHQNTPVSSLIVDANSEAVDIVCLGENLKPDDLNLEKSTIRRKHACVIQQVQAWQVRSMASFPVVVHGKMWAWLCCFHSSVKNFCYQTQRAVDYLVSHFSVRLSQVLDMQDVDRGLDLVQAVTSVRDVLKESPEGNKFMKLLGGIPNLTHIVPGCRGAAIQHKGQVFSVGIAPVEEIMMKIATKVKQEWTRVGKRHMMALRCLSDLDKEFAGIANIAAGAICVPVNEDGVMMFFREESGETIMWAGNPAKAAFRDPQTGHFHPRTDYSRFPLKETGMSAKWAPEAKLAATTIADCFTALCKDQEIGTFRELDSATLPVFSVDASGNITYWNASMETLTGTSASQAIGKAASSLVATESKDMLKELTEQACNRTKAKELIFSGNRALAHTFSRSSAQIIFVCQSLAYTDASKASFQKFAALVDSMAEGSQWVRPNNVVSPKLGAGIWYPAAEHSFQYHPDKNDSDSALLHEDRFSKTYQMMSKKDGALYTVKKIKVRQALKAGVSAADLRRDMSLMMRINTPFTSAVRDCFSAGEGKNLCLVMDENDDQSLSTLLSEAPEGMSASQVGTIADQLAKALDGVHSCGVIHRDLAPDTVKVRSADKTVQLVNLGLPSLAGKSAPGFYSSPERASGAGPSASDDMWASGVLMAEALLGSNKVKKDVSFMFSTQTDLVSQVVSECKSKSGFMGTVVEGLLSVDPASRTTAPALITQLQQRPRASEAN